MRYCGDVSLNMIGKQFGNLRCQKHVFKAYILPRTYIDTKAHCNVTLSAIIIIIITVASLLVPTLFWFLERTHKVCLHG